MLDIRESAKLTLQDGQESGHIFDCVLIRPGVGSSGIYTAENLALSLPAFSAGTHVYIDHPTANEEYERPERSVRDLIGVLHEDATQAEDGSIVAPVRFYPSWAQTISECYNDVGLSIYAFADGEIDADGVVPPLSFVRSVDVVTMAGAGGALLSVLESQRGSKTYGTIVEALKEGFNLNKMENVVDEKQFTSFVEATTTSIAEGFASLREAMESTVKAAVESAVSVVEEQPEAAVEDDIKSSEAELLELATALVKAQLPELAEERAKARIIAGEDAEKVIEEERAYFAEAQKVAGVKIEEAEPRVAPSVRFKSVKEVI